MSRILIYDLETGPNLAYTWGKYQQDVLEFEKEWQLLSVAYKWLGEKEVHAFGGDKFTEEILVTRLHQLFSEADIVIAHNGDNFDQRMANAKFIEYGLTPPEPYKSIDTKKVAKKYFRFNSNKLDDLGRVLGLGRKIQTGGFSLWMGCLMGDQKSWDKMLRYNKQDVKLLEKIYLKLRPWIDNHPGINIIDNIIDGCPKCGSRKLHRRGVRHTKVATTQRFQCQKCGGWSHSRLSTRSGVEIVN